MLAASCTDGTPVVAKGREGGDCFSGGPHEGTLPVFDRDEAPRHTERAASGRCSSALLGSRGRLWITLRVNAFRATLGGNHRGGCGMRYLLVGLLFLAGCSPSVAPSQSPPVGSSSAPSVAGSASPSPTCSPIGGMAAPCSPDEYAKVEAQNKLVNEAIAVYRRWTKENSRLYRVGGTRNITPEMEVTTAGEFRKSALLTFSDIKAAGIRAVSGDIKIVSIGPDLGVEDVTGQAAIVACLDGRSMRLEQRGRAFRAGVTFVEHVVAKTIDGDMKLWAVRSSEVKSC